MCFKGPLAVLMALCPREERGEIMALEPGGYADKLGNRYEGRWVVKQLLRMLNEDLLSVQVEAIGDEEKGVDLWVERPDGVRQAQQCKIRNGSYDRWTIADLARRDILGHAKNHLSRKITNEFALVTAVPSTLLHDICESARNSTGNAEEFYRHQIQEVGEQRRKAFLEFCNRLDIDSNQEAGRFEAYSYLKRLFIELWPDTTTSREELLGQAEVLVNKDPRETVSVLASFAQDNLRVELDAPLLWKYLADMGYHPRRLSHDRRIYPTIKNLQKRFVDSISCDLIAGELIPRDETKQILVALKEHTVVMLHGSPGQGKSGVLYELTEKLKAENIIYLPVRLDRQEPKNTTQQFGDDLGLPESPVTCLTALTGDKPAVLILDQLDAIRWTSRHSLNALQVCKDLVREVRSYRNFGNQISVVLACRTYDMQNDPEIKSWLQGEKANDDKLVEISVAPLSPEIVDSVIQNLGQNPEALSERQKQILASPQHLQMWVQIIQSKGTFEFQNRVELMREFWNAKMRELSQKGVAVSDRESLLTLLIKYMEQRGHISAPRTLVNDTVTLDAFLACGLVRISDGHITFSHQSYLDYQIASRIVREIYSQDRDITEWLGTKQQQSLFRREQLRQALCLLSEESPGEFLNTVKIILSSKNIRFHLKHLCLEVVGQLEAPSATLLEYLKSLVEEEEWREHVIGTVFVRHAPFVHWLIEEGLVSVWLESDKWRDTALWLLRTAPKTISDEIAKILEPYVDGNDEWQQIVLDCLPWSVEDDSDFMFKLRLELAKKGIFNNFVNWEKLEALQALQLLDSVLFSWTREDFSQSHFRQTQNRRSRIEHWTADAANALTKAVQDTPEYSWELLISQIVRLVPLNEEQSGALELWLDRDLLDIRHEMECLPNGLLQLAITAGVLLAKKSSGDYWSKTKLLRSHASSVVQFILLETYVALSEEYSDQVIEWLLDDFSRLNIGTGKSEPEWMPASRLLEGLTPHCSEDVFRRLEDTIIHYHSPRERRDAERWLSTWKQGFFGDYWGRAQHFLLPSLCRDRRRDSTNGLIGVLSRKYAKYAEYRFTHGMTMTGGRIVSPLPSDLLRLSDKAWLGIVANKSIPEERCRQLKQIDKSFASESGIWQFSRDLEQIAKRFPERFGQLALQFPKDAHPSYKAAIIEGLQQADPTNVSEEEKLIWKPPTVELIEKVLAKFGDDNSREYALRFCWLMHKRSADKWSDAALERLKNYACNHLDPENDKLNVYSDNDRDISKASVDSLMNNALNCVRGVAAFAIGQQLRNHGDLLDQFRSTIVHLCKDAHPAVKIAAIEACLSLLDLEGEQDFAISCFRKTSEEDIRVAASREGVYFFNYCIQSHYESLAPVIKQMLESEWPDVAQEGAEEVAARFLFHDLFKQELSQSLQGSKSQRKGLAKVVAHFVTKPEYFDKCSKIIRFLKDDPESDVRQELLSLFRNADIFQVPGGVGLMLDIVDSDTFRDDPSTLTHSLKDYTGTLLPFTDILFAMCDQFVGPIRDASRNPSSRGMYCISDFLPMLLRLYEQAEEQSDVNIVNRCLDAWDALFEERVGVVHELTRAID